MDNKEQYFELMNFLTEKVYEFIKSLFEKEAEKHATLSKKQDYLDFYLEYQNYRAGTTWLRPTIAQLLYCAVKYPNESFKKAFNGEILGCISAIEMLNTSTYLTNMMLDEKRGYTSKDRMKQAVITSYKFRELAQKVIHEHSPKEHTLYILQRMSEVNELIYEGQYIDVLDRKSVV